MTAAVANPGLPPDPYRTRPSGRSRQDVLRDIHGAVYAGHGTDGRYGNPDGKVFAAPLFDFKHLLDWLAADGRYHFLTVRDCLTRPLPSDRPIIVFRHDIDLDIDTAVQMAALQRDLGIRASYYILHTAPYYGRADGAVFLRHEDMAAQYRMLADGGHDVGLHTDALGLVLASGLDGLQAVVGELAWLRACGIPIVGTAAHNSYTVYGVENFAVFKDRPQRMFLGGCPPDVTLGGRTVALQRLDERALGLDYEANELFWRTDLTVRYACTWNVDLWHWQDRRTMRLPLEDDPENRPQGKALIPTDGLLDRCRHLAPGEVLLLAIHPVYFGARTAPDAPAPLLPDRTRPRGLLRRSPAWPPGTAVAGVAADAGGAIRSVGINIADDRGILTCTPDTPGDVDILFLGAANFDARTVTGPAQLQCRVRAQLQSALGRTVGVRKRAHPAMRPGTLLRTLAREVAERPPAAVVMELDLSRLTGAGAIKAFCAKAQAISGKAGTGPLYLVASPAGSAAVASIAEALDCTIVDPAGGDAPRNQPVPAVWSYGDHRRIADRLCALLAPALRPVHTGP